MELISDTASLHLGSGQWSYFTAMPFSIGEAGHITPYVHFLTALGL